MLTSQLISESRRRNLEASRRAAFAWAATLLASDLPEIITSTVAGSAPTWIFYAKLCVLVLVVVLGWTWKTASSLRTFLLLLLVLTVGRKLFAFLSPAPADILNDLHLGLPLRLIQLEAPRIGLSAAMVAVVLIFSGGKRDLFLRIGDLRRWGLPGIVLAVVIMILTFAFLDYRLPLPTPFIAVVPVILLSMAFAALAAFDEELRYRATLLSQLTDSVGKNHSLLITATYFGTAHYFGGVPSGIAGILVASSLGWLYAKMMMETKGMFIPWLNHFLTNVPTFLFWALSSA